MAIETLSQLCEQAKEAQGGGRENVGQRLLLFRPLARAVCEFVEREQARIGSAQRTRATLSELNQILMRMEREAPLLPAPEDISRYMALVRQLRQNIQELEQSVTPLTLFEPIR